MSDLTWEAVELRSRILERDRTLRDARRRQRWMELFVALQLLSGAFFFLPGSQSYRMMFRALPFVASLAGLVFPTGRISQVPTSTCAKWLLASFVLLAVGLLYPDAFLKSGLAQFVFQISIAAPAFWMAWMVRSPRRFARLLWIMLICSVASAGVGILQVLYPDTFLPPEFSELARRLNPTFVSDLSYAGPDGQTIIRPPGLSDMPGGAAVAGLIAVVLGVAYASQDKARRLLRVAAVGAVVIGMTVLYLTQVRSLTLMAIAGIASFVALRLRQGRILQSGWIALAAASALSASFLWATTLGGDTVRTRFSGLVETGVFETYKQSRGVFLEYTLRDVVQRFPFGAGLGRWGMMQIYFPESATSYARPVYVEIQFTGWLLDGGVLMWVLYGGALVSACWLAYTCALRGPTKSIRDLGAAVLAVQVPVIGLCFSATVFNTGLGVIFWMVTGGLFGAAHATRERRRTDEY